MTIKHYLILALLISIQGAFATGLQPTDTNASVRVQALDFDLEIRELYVSGMMEVQFVADRGEENAANLRFPLPPNSVLHKAEIYLPSQEQWMVAETMGRKEGQIIYDKIVKQKYDPLLIQKIGADFYRARVFPINEGGDLRMRVHYAHTLETVDNYYRLRVPFANPDSTAATPADGVTISLRTDPDYWTTGAWKMGDDMGTPSTLNDEMGTPSSVNLSNGNTFLDLADFTMDKDITLDLRTNEPIPQATALFYQPKASNLDGHLHTWWHPDFSDYPAVMSQPRHVIFVIDVSGSMSGAKMAQTRQAVIHSLEALNEEDYFGLVAFDNRVYTFRSEMTSGADIDAAIQWVSNLRAMGSTGLSAGLASAAAIGTNSPLTNASIDLLIITDGRPNVGSSTLDGILADIGAEMEQLRQHIRIFSVGIGYDLDQTLLNGLAQQTGGESTFALDDNEITGQILDLFARVRGGGVSQVRAMVQANGLQDNTFTWPRIFPGTVLQMGAKGNVGNQISLKIEGNLSNLQSFTLDTTVSPQRSNSTIHRIAAPLAAKTWADELERQIDQEGETRQLVDQAINLARTYGIVTRYTSLLALESDDMYAEHGVKRVTRDPAGIALEPVNTPSSVDESLIGGQGTVDSGESMPSPPPPGGQQSKPMPQPMPEMLTPMYPVNGNLLTNNSGWDDSNNGYAPSDSIDYDDDNLAEDEDYYEDYEPDMDDDSTTSIPIPSEKQTEGNTTTGSEDPLDSEGALDTLCESPVLDEQLHLEIPRLEFQGNYYWAKLQLDNLNGELILKVLHYGPFTSPSHNRCQSTKEVVLSVTLRLSIPLITFKDGLITNVILQGIQIPGSNLAFEIVSYELN